MKKILRFFRILFDTPHYNNNSLLKAMKEEKLGKKFLLHKIREVFWENPRPFHEQYHFRLTPLEKARLWLLQRKFPAFPKESNCDIINIEGHFLLGNASPAAKTLFLSALAKERVP